MATLLVINGGMTSPFKQGEVTLKMSWLKSWPMIAYYLRCAGEELVRHRPYVRAIELYWLDRLASVLERRLVKREFSSPTAEDMLLGIRGRSTSWDCLSEDDRLKLTHDLALLRRYLRRQKCEQWAIDILERVFSTAWVAAAVATMTTR